MKKLKPLLTDIAGVSLIILSILLGWLPGPGGIPLFLAGLGLLAINHEWARRLLNHAKKHGLQLSKVIFREHPWWKLILDLLSIALLAIGILVITQTTHNVWKVLSVSILCIGIAKSMRINFKTVGVSSF